MLNQYNFNQNIALLFTSRNQQINNDILTVWYSALSEYSDQEVSDALVALMKSTQYLSVGAIIEIINKSKSNEAQEAWSEVMTSVKNGGNFKIRARAAKALVSWVGGMQWLRDADSDKNDWYRKEFINIYNNTPEPIEPFRCPGLNAPIILKNSSDTGDLIDAQIYGLLK